jgi:hypothetical protein
MTEMNSNEAQELLAALKSDTARAKKVFKDWAAFDAARDQHKDQASEHKAEAKNMRARASEAKATGDKAGAKVHSDAARAHSRAASAHRDAANSPGDPVIEAQATGASRLAYSAGDKSDDEKFGVKFS